MVERIKIKASAKPLKRKQQKALDTLKAIAESVAVEAQMTALGNASKYNAEIYPNVARLLASRGAIQSEIAEALSVTTKTLQNWINQFPEMRAAVQAGNEVFDPRVERALAERAIGFYADVHEWKTANGMPVLKPVRKYFPPDVVACIFWLKNRKPALWRDVQEHHMSGEVQQTSAELLIEIRKDILELQSEGHLQGMALTSVTSQRSSGNGKQNGSGSSGGTEH